MRCFRLKLVVAVAMLCAAAKHSDAATLAGDFTIAGNPGNGWTHGFNDAGAFGTNDDINDVPFALANVGGSPGDRWTGDGTGDAGFPPNDLMLVNLGGGGTAGDHWGGGSITWDAGVAYHTWGNSTQIGGAISGDDAIFSTFTVAANGIYDVIGTWTENGNSGGANVDVLVNGASLGASSVDLDVDGDSTSIQSLGVALSTGDTVSFRTVRDLDVETGGSVRLDASVSLIPEPTTAALTVLGLLGLSMGLRRRAAKG